MGIESDQLVYEYLSRVGDLAQRRQVPSGDRMRLVSGLRDEIDRRRAKYEPETPAAVRRILERIGTPEEVLDALGASAAPRSPGAAPAPEPAPAVPTQRGGLRRKPVPPPRPAENVPPHLAGLDELGDGDGAEPQWWRVAPSAYGAGPQVEGFAGGIEIPDLFKEPAEPEGPDGGAAAPKPAPEPPSGSRARAALRVLRERRRKRKAAAAAEPEAAAAAAAPRAKPHAFLLLAALALAAGAVTGYWLVLAGGFLLAYASRVLGPAERKWVVFGLPGTVFTVGALWLWGRHTGRWGEALSTEDLGGVFRGMWPWLARGAGLVTALYLAWRARRR